MPGHTPGKPPAPIPRGNAGNIRTARKDHRRAKTCRRTDACPLLWQCGRSLL